MMKIHTYEHMSACPASILVHTKILLLSTALFHTVYGHIILRKVYAGHDNKSTNEQKECLLARLRACVSVS